MNWVSKEQSFDETGSELYSINLPIDGSIWGGFTGSQNDGEVFYQDEAGSSLEAENMIKGKIKYIRDGRIDCISAMIILQRFLRSKKNDI